MYWAWLRRIKKYLDLSERHPTHFPGGSAELGPFGEDGQEPSQGLGGRRMAGERRISHAAPEPTVYRQNIGNTSAAYRQRFREKRRTIKDIVK
jgi:hypothetical protein